MSLLFEGLVVHSVKHPGEEIAMENKIFELGKNLREKKKAEGKALGAQINIIISKYFRIY